MSEMIKTTEQLRPPNLESADIAYREAVDRGDIDPDETRDWQHGYEIGQSLLLKTQ